MRIRLSGPFTNFSGNILGAQFEDGIADVPQNIANLIAANLSGVMEIDAEGADIGPISFDPRATMILPEIPEIPRTTSNFPVDTEALAATVADLKTRLETLETADFGTAVTDLDTRVAALEAAAGGGA